MEILTTATLMRRSGTDTIAVELLASPPVDSPPSSVSNQDPSGQDDSADIIRAGTEAVLINNPENFSSRIGLWSTKILMHVLPIGESTVQGKSNSLCSYKARWRSNNDSIKGNIWAEYIASMCYFEVKIDWREELQHRHMVVVSIHVGILQ